MHFNRRIHIDETILKKKTSFDVKNFISKKFKNYENLNNENKIYELSFHDFDNHVIDLQKKQSFYDFIYSLFESKLKVFKIYFDKHLKNDFIRFFKLSIDVSILFVRKKTIIYDCV